MEDLHQLGVLLDVQHGGAVGGEQAGHGRLELVPAVGLDAGRSAQLGVCGPVTPSEKPSGGRPVSGS